MHERHKTFAKVQSRQRHLPQDLEHIAQMVSELMASWARRPWRIGSIRAMNSVIYINFFGGDLLTGGSVSTSISIGLSSGAGAGAGADSYSGAGACLMLSPTFIGTSTFLYEDSPAMLGSLMR